MEYTLHIAVTVVMYTILAGSFNFLWRFGGMLSLAHASVFGVGAYATALSASNGYTEVISLLMISSIASMLVSIGLTKLSERLEDDLFVVFSFAIQTILVSLFNNLDTVTGGPGGVVGYPPASFLGHPIDTTEQLLVVATVMSLLAQVLLWTIIRSPLGRTLRAICDDPVLAGALGKPVSRHRMEVAAISGALAGGAGTLFALLIRVVDLTSFSLNESIFIISCVVIGGAGTTMGPVIGAAMLVIAPELLVRVGMPSDYAGNAREILYGAAIIAFMIWYPGGLSASRSPRGGGDTP